MDDALHHPIVVDFPLRGEGWMAVTTPAHRVPSHGTDQLGQRYAFDFVRVDDRPGVHVHPASAWRTETIGGRTRECYAWGQPVHAPFDAEVVTASDGMAEREWVNPARELFRAMRTAATFTPEKLPDVLGNHVVLRATDVSATRGGDRSAGDVFAGFAHLAPGTVAVTAGQRLRAGDLLGRVGHTGNSTSPHLHFQLMDSADVLNANGLPCAFRGYEVARGGAWHPVVDGVPGRRERIRSTGPASGRASQSPR
ncbi:M23 family metallopeptidase [Agromyces aerolatus]|uniref:M23 family metallopeptidase n=1 Tax=Agromyces sp. LY-1074 TaxID=3074080 RepID=UPI00285A6808|nr:MULTISPECIES: M23 family metallopeptidase [unclassified Agromyces]MDR5699204.1 M23 family metallopeptidase [Agromyces sp. LY-1074]MDR5705500.1 M23 family metallopeptidase [Agromyces sp. LY-1358]